MQKVEQRVLLPPHHQWQADGRHSGGLTVIKVLIKVDTSFCGGGSSWALAPPLATYF